MHVQYTHHTSIMSGFHRAKVVPGIMEQRYSHNVGAASYTPMQYSLKADSAMTVVYEKQVKSHSMKNNVTMQYEIQFHLAKLLEPAHIYYIATVSSMQFNNIIISSIIESFNSTP